MTGIRIGFSTLTGWSLDLTQEVSDLNASAQCALVNAAMPRGQDTIFPDAGTTLLQQGLFGLLLDRGRTQHALNFAAAETRALINDHSPETVDQLDSLQLQIVEFAPPSLRVNMYATSPTGAVIGTDITTL